jgi:hypothetical protein
MRWRAETEGNIHVKCQLFLFYFDKVLNTLPDLVKVTNIKYDENCSAEYCSYDQIKEDEIDRTYIELREEEKCVQAFS